LIKNAPKYLEPFDLRFADNEHAYRRAPLKLSFDIAGESVAPLCLVNLLRIDVSAPVEE